MSACLGVSEIKSLSDKEVHLWVGAFSDQNKKANALSLLSADEVVRANRFVRPRDRDRYIYSRTLLRQVLSLYLSLMPEKIQFEYGEHGKPFVANQMVQFNLSGSGDVVLLAVTVCHEVGIDVERVRVGRDYLSLAKRFFCKSEFEAIAASEDSFAAFYRCWTRKEAFVKATGLGLTFGLSNFEVDVSVLSPKQSALCAVRDDFIEAKRWYVQSLSLGSIDQDYFAAIAVGGDLSSSFCTFRYFNFDVG